MLYKIDDFRTLNQRAVSRIAILLNEQPFHEFEIIVRPV